MIAVIFKYIGSKESSDDMKLGAWDAGRAMNSISRFDIVGGLKSTGQCEIAFRMPLTSR